MSAPRQSRRSNRTILAEIALRAKSTPSRSAGAFVRASTNRPCTRPGPDKMAAAVIDARLKGRQMSGHGSFPPPGQPPPPGAGPAHPAEPAYPPPAYALPRYPAPPGYPATLPAAHKPGAIPLRPLGLGDIYDAAFKIIRFNPRATVGSAVLVTVVAMLIPVLVTAVMTSALDLSSDLTFTDDGTPTATASAAQVAGFVAAYGSMLVGSMVQWFGLLFVTGMVTHVTAAAAVGRKLSLGEAWAATGGKRWRLVGLAVLLGLGSIAFIVVVARVIVVAALVLQTALAVLVGLGLGLGGVLGLVFFWVRVYYLAVPPLMLEPIGVFDALGRSWRLTSGQFWRTFGIALLTLVIAQIAGGILGVPFSLVGTFGPLLAGNVEVGLMIMVVANGLAAVISAAFTAPFLSTVTSLQYVDQRIRKEGYDVELMTRAGVVSP
jgi:hypothetical protein